MKQLKHIALIGILILNSCLNSEDYQIRKIFKSIVDNENCEIKFYYPNFISRDSRVNASELNKILEKYADYERFTNRCDEIQNEKRIIKGDYRVTLKTDDKLSIEFVTEIINYGGNQMDTVYHSLVINPQKISEKEFSYILLEPELIFPNFNRGNLYKYVKKYNTEKNERVNLLAYKSGSEYVITWGLKEKEFILYVGGEGEWTGNDKIEIPINEIE